MWIWILVTAAMAREYRLDPGSTAINLDGLLTVAASEIDLTRTDYVLIAELTNAGPSAIELVRLECTRGSALLPVSGRRGERIELLPGEHRSLQLLCDHGRGAAGDPSIRITEVRANPGDGAPATVFKNVVWRMKEADIVTRRSGTQLATGAYDRPAARARTGRAQLAPDAPLAIPAGGREPAGVPAAAAVSPPPAATLKPSPR